jgi:serine/threonine protein kinase
VVLTPGQAISSSRLLLNNGRLAEGQNGSLAGQALGHYQVISLVGTGAWEKFTAEDTRLGRKITVKLITTHFTRDSDRLRRFQQEARAASALNRPSILTIHEIGQIDSRHFMVTEFIEGETLRGRMTRPDEYARSALASDIASALAQLMRRASSIATLSRTSCFVRMAS